MENQPVHVEAWTICQVCARKVRAAESLAADAMGATMADDVSTRFPFISLEKALGRAEQLYDADKSGKAMLTPVAFEVWGYSLKSSGAFQTVGALKGYGLLTDEGSNDERRVQLSARARRYFLDERDEVRAGMLAEFALTPPLFRALWENDGWSSGIPADTVARSHLKLERGLNDQSARSLLSIYKENIQFAGLKTGEQRNAPVENEQPPAPIIRPMAATGFAPQPGSQAHPQPVAQPVKPIVFDMESVTVSAKVETQEDLRKLIADLERLAPLMPKKE